MAKRELGILLLLAAIWGSSFLFIRIAAPVIGPAPTVEWRLVVAAASLVLWAAILRRRMPPVVPWPRYLLLGLLNAAGPYTMIAMSELTLSAATAAILNATTPLFTALGAAIMLGDRLTPRKLTGVALGIGGVAVLVGFTPGHALPLGAVLLSLGAAILYAIAGIYAKTGFPGVPAQTMATHQQIGAAIVLLPFALLFHPHNAPTPAAVWSVLGLAVIATAVAYVLYFNLLREVGPTKALSVTFLVPVFGMLWGWLFLGERVALSSVIGLAIILLSVFLVTELRLSPGAPAVPVVPGD